jgi:hypothetical protein
MTVNSTTRVPVDDAYAALVGKAVYVFAYYEWTVVWIIETLQKGFVHRYSRGKPMTSGAVAKALRAVVESPATCFARVTKQELDSCLSTFDNLVTKRNALIHAHPCTDTDGSQILNYQTQVTGRLSDMKWPQREVESTIAEFDRAACAAGAIFDRLR